MSLDDLRLRNRSINRFRFQFIALDTVRSLSFLWCEQLLVPVPEFPFRNTLSPFNTRRNCDAPTLATALNFPFVLNVARFTRSFSFIRASYRKERIIVFIWFRAWRNSRDQEYEQVFSIYFPRLPISILIIKDLNGILDLAHETWSQVQRASRVSRLRCTTVSTCLVTCLPRATILKRCIGNEMVELPRCNRLSESADW